MWVFYGKGHGVLSILRFHCIRYPQILIGIWNSVHSPTSQCLPFTHKKTKKQKNKKPLNLRNTLITGSVSVEFSHSVVSDSLRPHEPQYTRHPCPPPTPGVHLNPCPLCQWCHPTISFSVIPLSSCLQSFLEPGSFQMSQFSASAGQSIGVSALTSAPPMNTQDWSPCIPRDSQEYSPTPQFKSINSLLLSFLYNPNLTLIHDY